MIKMESAFMETMLNSDIAFCAGFFDADGGVSIRKTTACLMFYNDNKQVLEKIRDVLLVDNSIRPREKPKGGTSYTVTIGKRDDVMRIAELFLSSDLVTVKRAKLIEALLLYPMADEEKERRRQERVATIQKIHSVREKQRERDRQIRVEQQIKEYRKREAYIRAHPEMPSRAIAAEIGASHVTVIKLRRELGLKQYSQHEMSDDDKRFIIDNPEMSSRTIAEKLGFSHVTVAKFRRTC